MSWWDIDLFWPLLLVSQVSGASVVVIITYWILEYNQFSWGKGSTSYHALMFTLGMVFLFGEAMLLFPVPKRLRMKSYFWRKVLHGVTQSLAVIFSIVGLKAIFLAKKLGKYNDFYSIHSWVGMTAAMMFFLQHGVAIFFYILSKFFGPRFMIRFTSMHTFFGYVLFAMSIASCLSGMDRWVQIFDSEGYHSRATPTLLGDIYALLMLLFGGVVAFLASRPAPRKSIRKKKDNADTEKGKDANGEKEDNLVNLGFDRGKNGLELNCATDTENVP